MDVLYNHDATTFFAKIEHTEIFSKHWLLISCVYNDKKDGYDLGVHTIKGGCKTLAEKHISVDDKSQKELLLESIDFAIEAVADLGYQVCSIRKLKAKFERGEAL